MTQYYITIVNILSIVAIMTSWWNDVLGVFGRVRVCAGYFLSKTGLIDPFGKLQLQTLPATILGTCFQFWCQTNWLTTSLLGLLVWGPTNIFIISCFVSKQTMVQLFPNKKESNLPLWGGKLKMGKMASISTLWLGTPNLCWAGAGGLVHSWPWFDIHCRFSNQRLGFFRPLPWPMADLTDSDAEPACCLSDSGGYFILTS